MVTYGRLLRIVGLGVLVAATLPVVAAAKTSAAVTLYVTGNGSAGGDCTKAKPCKTIGRALSLAKAGARIEVTGGTYKEQVKITKKVTLVGLGKPAIDATNLPNGVVISGDNASGTAIEGFTIRNATNEGVLLRKTDHVTVRNNIVSFNDRGAAAGATTGDCAPRGQIAGDCGGAIHLDGVSNGQILGNVVRNNAAGILLTDAGGPTTGNLLSGNVVITNFQGPGIRLSATAPNVSANGSRDISAGGVFSNQIVQNVVTGNGLLALGGGILLEATATGTAVYDNNVAGNTVAGNGLAGITLHLAATGGDVNDNQIVSNTLLNNGLRGGSSGQPGDPFAGVTTTVGIILFSEGAATAGDAVSGNTIVGAGVGIWALRVPGVSAASNSFVSVTTPLVSK